MNAEDAKAKQPLIDAVPGRHSGDVCFAGTRVPVSTLFECLAGGDSLATFLAGFPSVSTAQARFALHEATIGMVPGEQVVGIEEEPSLVCAMPGPHDGELCFAGTRVPVQDLFTHLRRGVSLDVFFERHPSVTREQAEFALRKANALIERDYGQPVRPMPEAADEGA